MINFFRKTRLKLAKDNSIIKYSKYAIGEIGLVVIGILIALQINNWNTNKLSEAKELNLLIELNSNLETNIKNLENDITLQKRGAWCIDYLIEHLDNKRPYYDSLDVYFHEADFAPDVLLTSSAFKTIQSIGLDLIKSDSLRREIINLFELSYPFLMQETRRLEDQLWPAVVVPMYQKHFRNMEAKFIPIDYKSLLEDEEFLNMLSRRGTMRKQSTRLKETATEQTHQVIQSIEKELEERRS